MMRICKSLVVFSVMATSTIYAQSNPELKAYQNTTPEDLTFRVVLDPSHRTSIATEVYTKVQKINKRLGDAFQKGDVLIQLDNEVFAGQYEKAKAVLERAKTNLAAKTELYNENITPLTEVNDAKAALATAVSELITAEKNMKESKIVAPYSGKVVSVDIEEHEYPIREKPIISIVDDHTLIARFLVPSSLYKDLKIDEPLYIKLNETGDVVVARIKRIGPSIDPSSSTIKVEAEVNNADDKLKSGMTGEATFEKPEEIKKPVINKVITKQKTSPVTKAEPKIKNVVKENKVEIVAKKNQVNLYEATTLLLQLQKNPSRTELQVQPEPIVVELAPSKEEDKQQVASEETKTTDQNVKEEIPETLTLDEKPRTPLLDNVGEQIINELVQKWDKSEEKPVTVNEEERPKPKTFSEFSKYWFREAHK